MSSPFHLRAVLGNKQITSLFITYRYYPLICVQPVLHLCNKALKLEGPKQAAKKVTKLLATLSPEVNKELSMLLDVQLQEKVEAVLACWLAKPHPAFTVPMATTLGITATSNVHHPQKVLVQGIIMFGEVVEVKASKDPRKKLEGMLQMAEKIASLEMRDVTESTCPIVINYVNKIKRCYIYHCNANVDNFLMCYPNFKHTTFKCTCEE
jgi:hypothetical protein